MKRSTGSYITSTTLGESVQAFVPHPLPPVAPFLAPEVYAELNRQAEVALARLAGVSGLVPSIEWLLYSAIRKEALLVDEGKQFHEGSLVNDGINEVWRISPAIVRWA